MLALFAHTWACLGAIVPAALHERLGHTPATAHAIRWRTAAARLAVVSIWASFAVACAAFMALPPGALPCSLSEAYAWLDVIAKSAFRSILRHFQSLALEEAELAAAAAEARSSQLSRLVHEMGNPLNGVYGNLVEIEALLNSGGPGDDKVIEGLFSGVSSSSGAAASGGAQRAPGEDPAALLAEELREGAWEALLCCQQLTVVLQSCLELSRLEIGAAQAAPTAVSAQVVLHQVAVQVRAARRRLPPPTRSSASVVGNIRSRSQVLEILLLGAACTISPPQHAIRRHLSAFRHLLQVHRAASHKALQIQFDIDPRVEGLLFSVDAGRVTQILAQFGWNAVKFTPPSPPAPAEPNYIVFKGRAVPVRPVFVLCCVLLCSVELCWVNF